MKNILRQRKAAVCLAVMHAPLAIAKLRVMITPLIDNLYWEFSRLKMRVPSFFFTGNGLVNIANWRLDDPTFSCLSGGWCYNHS